MREASRKQRATTDFYTHQRRATLLRKNGCGTSWFYIPNNTVPGFAENTSYIYSSLPFTPFLMLHSLRSRHFPYCRMASSASKTEEELQDTDYDPEEEEWKTGRRKKGRKKKEKPDPGLTRGTDIKDYLQPDGKQVEIELSKVRMD